jgi:hypothetical protein
MRHKKLGLAKETVRALTATQLTDVAGGATPYVTANCTHSQPTCWVSARCGSGSGN